MAAALDAVAQQGASTAIVYLMHHPIGNIRQTERVFFVMKEGIVHKNDRVAAAYSGAGDRARVGECWQS